MPDIFFSSEDEAPEGLRETLVKDEASGKFKINVVPNAKLAEFRENNTNLLKERDTLKAQVESVLPLVGEDPEAFKSELTQLRATAQQVADGKLKGSDVVQKEVEARVKSMEDSYQSQLQELGTKLAASQEFGQEMSGRYSSSVRDREITNAVLDAESGANPTALPDILSRASSIFQVAKDGSLVPRNGDTVIYGADGATPMSPKEWLGQLLEKAPYLGKSSAGGGAAGGEGKAKFGGMSEKDFNALTPQRRMALHREQQSK